MRSKYFLLLLFFLVQLSCSQQATVRFSQKAPDLVSADALTEIMLVNKSPRIVLRVPNTRKGVTNTQGTGNPRADVVKPIAVRNGSNSQIPHIDLQYDETSLYNTIEKQLFKEGFSLRDRGLFSEVLNGAQNANYSTLNAVTDTDLILELVRLEYPVGYITNICHTEPDSKQRLINEYRADQGATVEFKLVHVKTNKIVGSYKIHYTPCLDGCRGMYTRISKEGVFTRSQWLRPGEKTKLQKRVRSAYQALDQDELEVFITDATMQLVKTMR